jgi:hypothetical protein
MLLENLPNITLNFGSYLDYIIPQEVFIDLDNDLLSYRAFVRYNFSG